MKNKKIADVLEAAIKAPIGSTKRSQAKSLVVILRRAQGNDGQGGPGYKMDSTEPGSQYILTKVAKSAPGYNDMKIQATPPAPHRSNPIPPVSVSNLVPQAPTTQDGQGGPGDLSQLNLNSVGTPAQTTPNSNLSGAFAGYSLKDPSQIKPATNPATQLTGSKVTSTPFDMFPTLASSPVFQKTQPKQETPTVSTTPNTAPSQSFDELYNSANSSSNPTNTPDTSLPTTTDSSGSTTTTSPDVASTVQSAVDQNIGPTAFANQAMSDPELLQKIFPGMTNIPQGTLTDQVNALKTTLEKQDNITGLQNQLTQMIANGVTLGPMLTTYIQNKDQSLKEIDDQRRAATDNMLHADTGNSATASIWGRYMDYLNNLYTAQNSSYADFFNKSTQMYQSALTALDNQTSAAITKYQNDLNLGAQLTQADYNDMKQSLEDMYTETRDAPQRELENATLQMQLYQADAALAGGSTASGQGDWSAEYKRLSDQGILFDNTKGNEGALLPNVTDLNQAITTILSDAPKIGTDGALYIIGQGFEKSLQNIGSDMDKALPKADQYKQMVMAAVDDNTLSPDTAAQMVQEIGSATGMSVEDYLNDPNKAKAAQSAMIYAISGKGGGWFDSGALPDMSKFMSKFKGKLPDSLLTYIYNSAYAARNAINTSYSQAGNTSGAGATQWYANMSPQQIYDSYADQIAALNTPQAIGQYIGDGVSALIGGTATQALNLQTSS